MSRSLAPQQSTSLVWVTRRFAPCAHSDSHQAPRPYYAVYYFNLEFASTKRSNEHDARPGHPDTLYTTTYLYLRSLVEFRKNLKRHVSQIHFFAAN